MTEVRTGPDQDRIGDGSTGQDRTSQRRAGGGRGREQEPQPGGNAYVALLRSPGALRFSAAGALGRMPMAMFGLGTILLIAAVTGRYGAAGTVAAAGSVGYAICAPQIGRLADRFGQRRVLRPLTLVFAASSIAFIAAAQARAALWLLLVTGALAGASMPGLGSMVRARWSTLLAGSGRMHTAFALESVIDEMIFIVGPALVTLLATEVRPAAGVTVAAAFCVTGTLLFAGQRDTEPPPRPRPGGTGRRGARALAADGPGTAGQTARGTAGQTAPGTAGQSGGETAGRASSRARAAGPRSWQPRLPASGLVTLAPVYLFLGAMFSTIDLSTVAFAARHGHKPLAGFILGTYALGSAVGGLWYGSRTWRAPLERRFAITLCLTVTGVGTFWAQPGLLSLVLGIFFCGLTISPTLIAGYSLVERQAPAARRTEGMTWLSSTISVGVAGGAAIAGHIIDSSGPSWGYVFAAGCGSAAAAACLLGISKLRATDEAQAAQWVDAEP